MKTLRDLIVEYTLSETQKEQDLIIEEIKKIENNWMIPN